MKVLIKDLKPNPFRKMDKYPIDRQKVESLKTSIQNTEFWDNILARKKDNEIQIAYGHHRLIALQEIGIKEIDIPIKDLDDVTMIRIMANENMTDWSSTTSVIVETIQVAKEYIEKELKKYDSWNEFRKSELNKNIKFNNAQTFESAKCEKGIGQTIILNFLGSNWKQWQIQKALSIINEDDTKVDKKAILEIDNIGYAGDIKQVLLDNKIEKKDQKEIIENAFNLIDDIPINNKDRHTRLKAATEKAIEDFGYKTKKENFNKVFPKNNTEIDLNKGIDICIKNLIDINMSLTNGLLENWENIDINKRIEFINLGKRFFEILNNFKGDEKCKNLLQ